jgi:glycosyltransferase involved in cell wall biosynthesis
MYYRIQNDDSFNFEFINIYTKAKNKFIRYLIINFKVFYWLIININNSDKIIVDQSSVFFYFIPIFLLKKIKNFQVVSIVHHLNYTLINKKNINYFLKKLFEKNLVKHSNKIIVPSKTTKVEILNLFNSSNLEIINPGVDFKKRFKTNLHTNKNEYKLLFVGNVCDKRKGLIYLIEALNFINYTFSLNIVGNFDSNDFYFRSLMEKIEKSNKKVDFLGRLTDSELNDIYNETDICIIPSIHEGFGIVAIEALSFGIPIICSNISSLNEIVQHSVNGLFFETGSPIDLSKSLNYMMSNRYLYNKISLNASNSIDIFCNWDDTYIMFKNYITQ